NWKDLEITHSLFSKEKKNEQSKMLSEFYGNYFVLNEWDALLKNLFLQNHNEWSSEDFRRLAESDLISEKQNLIGEKLTKLIDDFYNFNVNNNFGDELYGLAIENINHQSIPNLEFYIRILKMLGLDDRAKLLENKTLENVKLRIMKSPRPVNSIQDLSIFSPIRDKSLVNKIEE
ncbi:hypothetical protein, partial [Alkanindiges hydrocarboniclasticus]|uniref:hypothetical protein n=1 Tax=Alkanindiges hydrocarboniclasticus TaxID=1907941 RepID=UPI00130180FD